MNWYGRLNALGIRNSYSLKFLAVAFLGIHLPLICLLIYFIATHALDATALKVALVVLVATLGGTAATLFIQHSLLAPVRLAEKALADYQKTGLLPILPIHYTDEAGLLLARLQHSVTQLDQMLTEKENILTSLSHDLRSPLSSIASAADILAENAVVDDRLLLESIKDTATRELDQIDNLLVASKLDREELVLNKTLFAASSVIDEVRRNMDLHARSQKVSLLAEVPAEQLYIKADRPRLVQALDNLVFAAIENTPSGGIVSLKAEPSGDSCRILVQDTGHGLSEPQQKAISEFLRHEQESQPDATLGLRIGSHLIEIHGSKVEIEQTSRTGTRLSITLAGS